MFGNLFNDPRIYIYIYMCVCVKMNRDEKIQGLLWMILFLEIFANDKRFGF